MYHKEVNGLTQTQVIENIKDVINSEYFNRYEFSSGENIINSDIIKIDSIGGPKEDTLLPTKVSELSDIISKIYDTMNSIGILNSTLFILKLPDDRVQKMGFEKRLYDKDLELSLTIASTREMSNKSYNFKVYSFGFEESVLEAEGLDYKDANKKRAVWYREITRNLNKILTYKVR